jgi:hypothetical protein
LFKLSLFASYSYPKHQTRHAEGGLAKEAIVSKMGIVQLESIREIFKMTGHFLADIGKKSYICGKK